MTKLQISKIFRYTARSILLVLAVLIFIFALLSGAEQYNAGLMGIVYNSPNALPWLILLILVYLAWKKELIGGLLIILMGIISIFAFNTFKHIAVFYIISLPLIILGSFFLISWKLSNKKTNLPS